MKLSTRIMVFGTFDILHKGHLNFFKQARALSKKPFLIVSVARDINVKKIKGHKPVNCEKKRFMKVKALKFVDKTVLGGIKNHIPHIIKEKPDVIALGYDQKKYVQNLKSDLTRRGLNVKIERLKAFMPQVYKSSLINK